MEGTLIGLIAAAFIALVGIVATMGFRKGAANMPSAQPAPALAAGQQLNQDRETARASTARATQIGQATELGKVARLPTADERSVQLATLSNQRTSR